MRTPSRLRLVLLSVVTAGAIALTGCASASQAPAAPPATTQQPAASAAPTTQAGECTYPRSQRPASKQVTAPGAKPIATGDFPVTVATSIGDLAITLDGTAAPCTVNSFLSLSEQGYFNDTQCHRLTTAGIFVLQCGDPTGKGTGGPGYSFNDELKGSEKYPAGTLAMANAGPNTNGSQFFIVYAETPLPAKYTVFGHLDEASTKKVAEVAAAGTVEGGPDGTPKTPVTITSITDR